MRVGRVSRTSSSHCLIPLTLLEYWKIFASSFPPFLSWPKQGQSFSCLICLLLLANLSLTGLSWKSLLDLPPAPSIPEAYAAFHSSLTWQRWLCSLRRQESCGPILSSQRGWRENENKYCRGLLRHVELHSSAPPLPSTHKEDEFLR